MPSVFESKPPAKIILPPEVLTVLFPLRSTSLLAVPEVVFTELDHKTTSPPFVVKSTFVSINIYPFPLKTILAFDAPDVSKSTSTEA